jgi:hypothetical protein
MTKANGNPQAVPVERRSGIDRRQQEGPPPFRTERRRGVEPRRPEVTELDMTPSQWDTLHADLPENGPR